MGQASGLGATERRSHRLSRRQDMFSEFGNELMEELVLAFGIVIVMVHDVAPDFNLFAGFQLEILRKFSTLDS